MKIGILVLIPTCLYLLIFLWLRRKFVCHNFHGEMQLHCTHWTTSGRNTSDCLFQSPFSFLFCAKITKITSTKNPLATVVKKLVFSPAGRETLIFRTFRQSYLIEFFRFAIAVITCDRMRSLATNAMSHAISQHIILVRVVWAVAFNAKKRVRVRVRTIFASPLKMWCNIAFVASDLMRSHAIACYRCDRKPEKTLLDTTVWMSGK